MAFFDGNVAGNEGVPVTDSDQIFGDPTWAFDDNQQFDSYDAISFYPDSWKTPAQPPLVDPRDLPQQTTETDSAPASSSPSAGSDMANGLVATAMGPSMASLNGPSANQAALPPGALHTLTQAQREKLSKIAMPSHLQYHSSPKSEPSPESATGAKALSMSSPEDQSLSSKSSRKRKSSADDDEDDDDDLEGQPVKKSAHNMIEKRYRTNLNDKIAALRDSVPSLRIMSKSARGEDTTGDREELHGLTPAHKLNKATVLSKATEYIRHLEKRNNRLMEENNAMQARVAAFEKLFLSGALNGNMSPMQQHSPPQTYMQEAHGLPNSPMGTPNQADPPGMIPVPDDMKRILAAQMATGQPYPIPQQSYRPNPGLIRQQQLQQQQHSMDPRAWHNAGPYFGKLMVGSLAGLMLFEVARESEQGTETTEGRGLFALPVQLLSYLSTSANLNVMGYHIGISDLIFSFKLVLLLCSVCWLVLPSLLRPKSPQTKAGKEAQASLEAAPSLASPIHVRRQAWLTAIQTVWVPRHNFFLEAAALGLKTAKLSLRNMIGVTGYQMLTGLTEDQEIARIQAWTIALDAQLAGGDVEISKSRLTLTLLASGTLPDTPLRLMLKALHIRVLLWEIGLTGVQLGIVNTIALKLARTQWNEAKQLHRLLTQLRRGGQEQSDEDLPDHLAMLLEQDADEVLHDSIIQRAHNLAWNRPTSHNAIGVTDGMDTVVEDTAVLSPMDAVAAWWSNMTLQTALTNSLLIREEEDGDIKQLVDDGITMAIRTAPVGSVAQHRALVARAVFSNEKRGANIAAVIQAIGPLANSVFVNETVEAADEGSGLATPQIKIPPSMLSEAEIYMCLQCAKAIAHLQRYAPPEEPVSVYSIIEEEIHISDDMSLLGYAAAFTLMERLASHTCAAEACSSALERLAGSLRIWAGKDVGLAQEVKQEMVERCLAVTRAVVGMNMETDTGYGSMSGSDDEGCSTETERFTPSSTATTTTTTTTSSSS